MLIMQQKVGGRWSSDETGCGEEVGDVVDVLVLRTSTTGKGGTNGRRGRFSAFPGGLKGGG
jgi:hypothetical protein